MSLTPIACRILTKHGFLAVGRASSRMGVPISNTFSCVILVDEHYIRKYIGHVLKANYVVISLTTFSGFPLNRQLHLGISLHCILPQRCPPSCSHCLVHIVCVVDLLIGDLF